MPANSGEKVVAGSDLAMPLTIADAALIGGPVDVAVNFGVIALGVTRISVTVPGVKPGDICFCLPKTGDALITLGCVIQQVAEVTAVDTCRVTIDCPIALGVSLGNRNMTFTWMKKS